MPMHVIHIIPGGRTPSIHIEAKCQVDEASKQPSPGKVYFHCILGDYHVDHLVKVCRIFALPRS